jgi:hypothetical protein
MGMMNDLCLVRTALSVDPAIQKVYFDREARIFTTEPPKRSWGCCSREDAITESCEDIWMYFEVLFNCQFHSTTAFARAIDQLKIDHGSHSVPIQTLTTGLFQRLYLFGERNESQKEPTEPTISYPATHHDDQPAEEPDKRKLHGRSKELYEHLAEYVFPNEAPSQKKGFRDRSVLCGK